MLRKQVNLLFALLPLLLTACTSVQNTVNANYNFQPSVAELPEIPFEVPEFTWDYLAAVEVVEDNEPVDINRVDITEIFTPADRSQVAITDPKLFAFDNKILIDLTKISEEDYAFPLPGAKVISPYAGKRKNHAGIDLKTRANDTIVSAFDGIVRMSRSWAAYGNVIVIRHYNGLETVYSHNSKNLVKPGDRVKAGQAIALTGRTGRATTDHLHFETRINGEHFNPELLFDMQAQELHPKSLLCVKNGNKVVVNQVDPFPYQANYLTRNESGN